jgi:lipopolysaccharide/colanic/teichoic acid biosynthesis glycosyltransferase
MNQESRGCVRADFSKVKRIFDLICVLAGLFFLWPVLLLIAGLVFLMVGSPVLFSQQRPGLRGKPFLMLKFRTMTHARDAQGNLLPDEQRLTRLGRLLRTTSLDELPELLNVLTGDMSLVGPRPLLMEYVPRYNPQQARRHEVRPGITGWAQVNGRNAISWEEKFTLDVWYVDNQSLWLDIKILFQTLVAVLKRDGIGAIGHTTMPVFTGSQSQSASGEPSRAGSAIRS